jgi:hypothetical protein
MSFLDRLRQLVLPSKKTAPESEFDPELFVYVKIPGPIQPIDRGTMFEDPLEAKLQEQSLGTISGGGSQLGDERPDGTRPIDFCGLDIDVTDQERALTFLREELPHLRIPEGTELHYTRLGMKLQDQYSGGSWQIEQPRTFLHPGFDI